MVTVDTLRADHLGVYGYSRDTSPAFDTLAGESLRFARAYSAAPWTVPALGSLLTGTFPDTHQASFDAQVPPRLENLAQVLAARGYRTAAHVDSAAPTVRIGMMRGFEELGTEPRRLEPILRWIRSSEEPFFLWLHYLDPHAPYDPADAQLRRFWSDPVRAVLSTQTYVADHCPVLGEGEREQVIALYDGEIAETDADLGRLFGALREMPLWSEFGNNTR